eukprot:SAG25_NODE_4148_length_879_cov_2.155128_1_plen_82_part_01
MPSTGGAHEDDFLCACAAGDAARITALAEAGCDTTASDDEGATGLMNATSSGSAAAVKTVLALGGSELEATNKDGATAFLWA